MGLVVEKSLCGFQGFPIFFPVSNQIFDHNNDVTQVPGYFEIQICVHFT